MTKLPQPRFNLRLAQSKRPTLIMLVFRYRGKKLTYSTGFNILPREWNFNTQRPFEAERRKDLWLIKTHLDAIAHACQSIYLETNFGQLGIAEYKERLDIATGKKEKDPLAASVSFLDFMKAEIEELGQLDVKESTLRPYRSMVKVLEQFEKQRGRWKFEDVDWDFRAELIDWLSEQAIQLSYGNCILNILRQFLERARRKKLHSNTQYQGSGWTIPLKKARSQKVVLNANELQQLAELNLHGCKEKVRDLFLIGAGTGQRFSDYSRYESHNFYHTSNGTPLLSVISQKTATPARVPLTIFPWLIPTLEKYNYTSPKMSMEAFNIRIKEICKQAGIKQKVLKVEQLMGWKAQIKKSYVSKYELVSSHTCRRSFATNLYRMGYSLGQIMPMTGHSTEAQLRTYIGIDAEENALAIARSIKLQRANQ